jgi:hypothetical protein
LFIFSIVVVYAVYKSDKESQARRDARDATVAADLQNRMGRSLGDASIYGINDTNPDPSYSLDPKNPHGGDSERLKFDDCLADDTECYFAYIKDGIILQHVTLSSRKVGNQMELLSADWESANNLGVFACGFDGRPQTSTPFNDWFGVATNYKAGHPTIFTYFYSEATNMTLFIETYQMKILDVKMNLKPGTVDELENCVKDVIFYKEPMELLRISRSNSNPT